MTRMVLAWVVVLAGSGCFVPASEEQAPGSDAGRDAGAVADAGTVPDAGGAPDAGPVPCTSDTACALGSVCEGCTPATATCTAGCRGDVQCPAQQHCQLGVVCFTCPCPPGVCVAGPPQAVDNTGVVFPDCAPWDGPALTFQLGAGAVCPPDPSTPGLVVSLWGAVLQPMTWTLASGANGNSNTQVCSGTECFVIDRGTFTITAITNAAVEGHYNMQFLNAPTRSGTFRVDRCGQDGGVVTRCG